MPRKKAPEGYKPKDLIGIPWMVAFALRADGWFLRAENILAKPNPMPESVADRPTRAHEHVFLLTKHARYFYDADAVRQPASDALIKRIQRGTTRARTRRILLRVALNPQAAPRRVLSPTLVPRSTDNEATAVATPDSTIGGMD